MAGVLQTLGKLAQGDRGLRDRELIAALANMVRSYQTLIGSGLVYQQAVANPAQEAIISTLTQLFEEFRGVERQHLGYTTLKDRDVLEALVFILRLAHLHTSGRPLSRGFVDFLHERFPLAQAAISGETQSASRIILP
jgi:hypothetical protein